MQSSSHRAHRESGGASGGKGSERSLLEPVHWALAGSAVPFEAAIRGEWAITDGGGSSAVASDLHLLLVQENSSERESKRAAMKDHIYITTDDFEKIQRLIRGCRAGSSPDLECLDRLEQELDRAEVVEPEAVPRDVVTMNSEVRLRDLDSGGLKVYKLVFPSQFRWGDNSVSILAPIGTAMLGYRAGDVIEWRVPKGTRRLKVVEVLYQPEAAGVRGN